MRALRHNLELKLLALVMAVAVSFYVRRERNVVAETLDLPVPIQAAPGQRIIEPPGNFRIQVRLQGPAELVRELTPDLLAFKYDLGDARPGRRMNIPFDIELPERYRGQVDLSWTPRSFPLRLVSDTSSEMPVIIRPVNSPTQWSLTAPLTATPGAVTITGSAEDVAAVAKVVAFVALPAASQVNELVTLQAQDMNGRSLTGRVRLQPAQVTVVGEQEPALLEKRVPVQPEFRLPSGMRVRSISVTPERVRVRGPGEAVSGIYYVPTAPFSVEPGRDVIQKQVQVPAPRAGVQALPALVTVRLELETSGSR